MDKNNKESKDEKKFPFSIQIDKQDIKLKLKDNMQSLADKFSWKKFKSGFLTSKKALSITAIIILIGIGLFTQLFDQGPDPDYQPDSSEESMIYEEALEVEEIEEEEVEEEEVMTDSEEQDVEIETEEQEEEASTEVLQESRAQPNFEHPLAGAEVIQGFGWNKHPVLDDWRFNQGVDFLARESTPIKATKSGVVKEIREDNFLGLLIVIEHDGGYQTLYGHAERLYLEEGQQVNAGQDIGEVGSSGLAIEPTLHFQIHAQDSASDPAKYLSLE